MIMDTKQLTTAEKYRIVERWCYHYDALGNRQRGKLYNRMLKEGFRFSDNERGNDKVVDAAYIILRLLVFSSIQMKKP